MTINVDSYVSLQRSQLHPENIIYLFLLYLRIEGQIDLTFEFQYFQFFEPCLNLLSQQQLFPVFEQYEESGTYVGLKVRVPKFKVDVWDTIFCFYSK